MKASEQLLSCIRPGNIYMDNSYLWEESSSKEFIVEDQMELEEQIKTCYQQQCFKNYHRLFEQFYIITTQNQHEVLKTGKTQYCSLISKPSQVIYSYPNLDSYYTTYSNLLPMFIHPHQIRLHLTSKNQQYQLISKDHHNAIEKFILLLEDNGERKGIECRYNQIGKLFVICLNKREERESQKIGFITQTCYCFISRFPFISFFLNICQKLSQQFPNTNFPILEQIYFYKQNIGSEQYIIFKDKNQFYLHIKNNADIHRYIQDWSHIQHQNPFALFHVIQIVLSQYSICFHAKYTDKLSKFILFLLSIIHPFKWVHPLVVILPSSLKSLDQAPFPVMYGYKCNWSNCGGQQDKPKKPCAFKKNIITYDIDNNRFYNLKNMAFDELKHTSIESIRNWIKQIGWTAKGQYKILHSHYTTFQRLKKTQMYIELNRLRKSMVFK